MATLILLQIVVFYRKKICSVRHKEDEMKLIGGVLYVTAIWLFCAFKMGTGNPATWLIALLFLIHAIGDLAGPEEKEGRPSFLVIFVGIPWTILTLTAALGLITTWPAAYDGIPKAVQVAQDTWCVLQGLLLYGTPLIGILLIPTIIRKWANYSKA
jgi:hypothetical protein